MALVTGGAVRIGRAIALGLAGAGHDVLVHYRSSRDAAEQVAQEIRNSGQRAAIVGADLSADEAASAVIDAARVAFGRLDVLVNSAAGFESRPLAEVDVGAWDAVMALNVRAPHLLVRAAKALLEEAEGCVVNLVDLSAFQPWTEYPVHAVSKAALAHLTRVQARAFAPRVRVNAIAPGAVLPPEDYAPERLDALRTATPLKRLGSPDDVVQAVLYLVRARFVTGQVLAVDGGRLLGSTDPPG